MGMGSNPEYPVRCHGSASVLLVSSYIVFRSP